ncbi:hypothetical protein HAX54_006848 [Datura stramonium]|uniref:DUF4283 domain-containing protein n=1 Tax=Datura stramonium TaxID=4076 RepID=A0ABS8WYD1_DATST|nr:hypothetical protein [Datura stramonium]
MRGELTLGVERGIERKLTKPASDCHSWWEEASEAGVGHKKLWRPRWRTQWGFVWYQIKMVSLLLYLRKNMLKRRWKNGTTYMIGAKPGYNTMKRYIEQRWSNVASPDIFMHEDGYFVIKFKSMEDKNEVLYSRPHTMTKDHVVSRSEHRSGPRHGAMNRDWLQVDL